MKGFKLPPKNKAIRKQIAEYILRKELKELRDEVSNFGIMFAERELAILTLVHALLYLGAQLEPVPALRPRETHTSSDYDNSGQFSELTQSHESHGRAAPLILPERDALASRENSGPKDLFTALPATKVASHGES